MTAIRDVRLKEVVRPLRSTFSTSLGQKEHLRSVVVSVRLASGASGTGEVPTSIAFKEETLPLMREVLREAAGTIRGSSIEEYGGLVHRLRLAHPSAFMTISGLEVAMFRAFLASLCLRESSYWGSRSSSLETDVTIPILPDEGRRARFLARAVSLGFTTYKLKVSGDVGQDIAILSLLYRDLEQKVPGFRLRLDGNQGYTEAAFLAMVRGIEKRGMAIELFEQPLRKDDLRGYEKIRGHGSIPVILDETIVRLSDAQRAIDHNLCDGMNIKVAKSGLAESLEIATLAREHRMKLMIGSMIETMVGLSAAIFFAAGTGYFDYVDLDGAHFLFGANQYPDITIEGPRFSITR